MIRRIAAILAALAVFSGCNPSARKEETFCITGRIIDPDGCLVRSIDGMRVSATDKSAGKTYTGTVGTEDEVTCRYSVENLPSGDYVLSFSSPYYEPAEYPLSLRADKTLDVTMKPLSLFSLDVAELRFASRVTTREFTITNLMDKSVYLSLLPDDTVALLVRNISGLQRMTQVLGWQGLLEAGETRVLTVEIQHDGKESLLEGSLAVEIDGMRLSSLPLVIETTSRDLYGNLVGRVTDGQGHPLKDISVYCNCTDTVVLTDEDGRYSFDDLPYLSQVRVIAFSEFYQWKESEFKNYVRDEIEIDLSLERCRNHLVLGRQEIDFGTGSVSRSTAPVSAEIDVTAETDDPVQFSVLTKVIGGETYPGLNFVANGQFQSSLKLWFQLDRSIGQVGDFRFTAVLKTDSAGTYLIPVRFSNTE